MRSDRFDKATQKVRRAIKKAAAKTSQGGKRASTIRGLQDPAALLRPKLQQIFPVA